MRVVGLGNSVLAGKPEILFDAERVLEAAARKPLDGLIRIVDALNDAGA